MEKRTGFSIATLISGNYIASPGHAYALNLEDCTVKGKFTLIRGMHMHAFARHEKVLKIMGDRNHGKIFSESSAANLISRVDFERPCPLG
jgi:hypothetical protein